jgi:hypothetical protein
MLWLSVLRSLCGCRLPRVLAGPARGAGSALSWRLGRRD